MVFKNGKDEGDAVTKTVMFDRVFTEPDIYFLNVDVEMSESRTFGPGANVLLRRQPCAYFFLSSPSNGLIYGLQY